MPVTTLLPDTLPADQVRAVVRAVNLAPPVGDPANVLVVPDLAGLSLGTVRALSLILEEPPDHVRVVRDPLALQPLTEADLAAELDRRLPR